MRMFIPLSLIVLASPAGAQAPLSAGQFGWQPTAPYVTAGQDEPGYRNWYMAAPWHGSYVKSFHDYLTSYGVGGVVPTWQLLRTASDWQKCGAAAFELPPPQEWPNIVQTLRYIRDRVIPAIGPVEPVSVYRNATLNQCAGGARESAHRFTQAVDLVPLLPTTREQLIRRLCAAHVREGERYRVGLGFYPFLRFHIDSRKFRKWGFANSAEAAACTPPPVSPVAGAPVSNGPNATPPASDAPPPLATERGGPPG